MGIWCSCVECIGHGSEQGIEEPLDDLHQKISDLFKKEGPSPQVDELLNKCPDDHGECYVCSKIICPHGDFLHFHHDGCPSCSEPLKYTPEQVEAMNKEKDA